jgi:predicted nucleic acid-binding Zn ribbon protein
MSVPLSSVLKGLVKRYGLERALLEQRLPSYWAQAVGDRIAQISQIRGFENGVLRVHVSEAAWRSEVILRRNELRTELNTLIGEPVITEIQVR